MADTQPPEQAPPTAPAQPTADTSASPDPNPDPNPNSQPIPFGSDTDSDSDSDGDTHLTLANLLRTNKLMAEALRAGTHTHTTTHQDQHQPPPLTDNNNNENIPTTLFFYGTLQDPTLLQSITNLPAPLPALEDAHIQGGFDLRLWGGKYPVLVANPASEAVIKGKVWRVGGEADGFGAEAWERLRRYETEAYDYVECVVRVGGEGGGGGDGAAGEEVKAVVFKWAGDAGSGELSDGVFDLDAWREERSMGGLFGLVGE
ncbi:uncharacterized protein B0H64DRAFT_444108 [Chaetomium fimeti]|uniref:Putative gamma-glutamylcyclotransferase n=1 Tax=Chaetomium fimeti TaxID=1854472 RepID=A0AAE0HEP8_9PEZI|nr:hypothetical protein B0H64DRAFT_444108 [Chaetomium fimeti]